MIKSKNLLVSKIVKFWYKTFKKPLYYEYKEFLNDKKRIEKYDSNFNLHLKNISQAIDSKNELNFKHSGHIGDLIYALSVIKELSKERKCNLYIRINQSLAGNHFFKHPSGNILISNRIYEMLLPLLESQSYINEVGLFVDQEIHIDLDLFRKFPFSNRFHSVRWYFHLVGKQFDMSIPYLKVDNTEKHKNKIVIVRTFRGRNPLINYSFLNKYEDIIFLGTKDEYNNFVKIVPKTSFYNVKNFLELAQIMNTSKLVITNQTFAFSVAEGLKTNRILEASPDFPVVFPIGGNGFDFYFQEQFERQVSEFLDF